jgi:hypothetical protein
MNACNATDSDRSDKRGGGQRTARSGATSGATRRRKAAIYWLEARLRNSDHGRGPSKVAGRVQMTAVEHAQKRLG